MTQQDKKNWITGLIFLLIGLLMWGGKKKAVGTVEVGKGEFGEFGTDGDFMEEETKVDTSLATPSYVGKVGNTEPVTVVKVEKVATSGTQAFAPTTTYSTFKPSTNQQKLSAIDYACQNNQCK